MKKIAIDTSVLSEIIGQGCIYVDKTRCCLDMIESGKFFFLARPRRFGKSLMVDTLANILQGNRKLFEGTYIWDKYAFEPCPVLRFSMNDLRAGSYDVNVRLLMSSIASKAEEFGIPLDTSVEEPFFHFAQLIRGVSKKYGRQVAVLIDEYDYPLMDSVADLSRFVKMRDMLSSFYETLKVEEASVRFCFITGITRFPHVSIFSKLNNLIDITNDPKYASICGYSDDELDTYFGPYVEKHFSDSAISDEEGRRAFRQTIKEYYDGYRFCVEDDVTLYNPVSVGKFFMNGCVFRNYWIGTGAQSLVNSLVGANSAFFKDKSDFVIPVSELDTFSLEDLAGRSASRESIYSFLVQAGYMTIKGLDGGRLRLGYPNREVADTIEARVLAS